MSSSDEEPTITGTASGVQKHETTAASRKKDDHTTETSKRSSRQPKSSSSTTIALPRFITDANNPVGFLYTTTRTFALSSVRLVRRCSKPDAKGKAIKSVLCCLAVKRF